MAQQSSENIEFSETATGFYLSVADLSDMSESEYKMVEEILTKLRERNTTKYFELLKSESEAFSSYLRSFFSSYRKHIYFPKGHPQYNPEGCDLD